MMWIVVVCLLLCVVGADVLFTFTPDTCERGRVWSKNGSFELMFSKLTVECEPSLGMKATSPSAAVVGKMSAILDDSHGALVFDFWFKPTHVNTSILTVVQANHVLEPSASSICDRKGILFQLLLESNILITRYGVIDGIAGSWCSDSSYSFPTSSVFKVTHVVVVLSSQAIYVNGEKLPKIEKKKRNKKKITFNVQDWKQKPTHLRLFSDETLLDGSTFDGPTMYQLEIRDKEMTDSDVLGSFIRGVEPAPPVAFNQTIYVNEDAENQPGTHALDWYEEPTLPSEAALIDGPKFISVSQEAKELIIQTMANHTIYWNVSVNVTVYLYLAGVPDIGTLYFSNGTRASLATPEKLVPLGLAPIQKIMYIPPYNVHSSDNEILAVFPYCVSDSPISDASQCPSLAFVSLIVVSVNDPPIALDVPTVTAYEGLWGSVEIPLRGYDVDEFDSIQNVEITNPPAYGALALSVSIFRQDMIPHGTPLADLNYIVQGQETVYVEYTWGPESSSKTESIVQGQSMIDEFSFRVQDSFGAHSLSRRIEIVVASAVVAEADTIAYICEDTMGTLHWHGRDVSGFQRLVGFYVEKVPSQGVGLLVDAVSNETIQEGAQLDVTATLPYDAEIHVSFRPRANFCQDESSDLDLDNSLRFRAVAFENKTIASVSDPFTQFVHVECKLDPIEISAPNLALTVKESSLKHLPAESCDAECPALLKIGNITVTSNDRSAEKALVSVSSDLGYVSFNKDYWNLTEHVSGRRYLASGRVSFYAYPVDLQNILSDLKYQSLTHGNDSVVIVIQYGNCTESDLLLQSSIRTPVCHASRHDINVVVQKDQHRYKSTTHLMVGFPWHVLFCLLAYPVLYWAVFYLQSSCNSDNETVQDMPRFIQHQDEHGVFFYEDTVEGTVRWDLPEDEEFTKFEDLQKK